MCGIGWETAEFDAEDATDAGFPEAGWYARWVLSTDGLEEGDWVGPFATEAEAESMGRALAREEHSLRGGE